MTDLTVNSKYLDFKSQALSSKLIKHEVPLCTVEILSEDKIKLAGTIVPITKEAFLNLIKILGLTNIFLSKFQNATNEKAKAELIKIMQTAACSDEKKSMVTLVLNQETKNIVAVVTKNSVGLTTNSFFKLFEDVMNNHKNMEIKNMSVRGNTVEISVVNKDWEFNIGGLKDEYFHTGLVFIQTPNETVICPFNERLTCTNGMVVQTKGSSIILKHSDATSVNGFISHITNIKGLSFFEQEFKIRVMKMINTVASYAEMKMVYDNLKYHIDTEDPFVKAKVMQFVDVDYVWKQYMNQKFDLLKADKDLLKKVKTHMSVWELVNGLTDLSSHAEQHNIRFKYEGDYSVFQLQKLAGELVMKDPLDLEFESKIPKVDFGIVIPENTLTV